MSDKPARGSGDPFAIIDLTGLMQKNMHLGLILRSAIDEYIIDYTPAEPIVCHFCRRNIDLGRLTSAQDKWKVLDQIAIHCNDCGYRFCSAQCLSSHKPPKHQIAKKSKDLADLFYDKHEE